jgi:hypothetical protein
MSTWRKRLSIVAAAALSTTGLGVAAATAAHAATCTTYYISTSGNDGNSGCSTSAPWKSIAKVNATTFAAGASILFQDGGSWTGELHPLGSGSASSHVVISSYGSGARPIIAGNGAAAAIYLVNQSYWTIQNLEITDNAATAALRSGIQLQNNTSGILKGISIIDNNIHNVKGYWSSTAGIQPSTSSGIAFNLSDSYAANGWSGVLINGNTLTTDDAGGIYLGSLAGKGHDQNTTGVDIENNTLTDVGGNDIVCIFCVDALVQYNVATNSGSRYSGAGIWTALSTGAVEQYNEVSEQHKHGSDGQAFDTDLGTKNITVQYNYTHSDAWGFFEFCCNGSDGTVSSVTRYNISQNDGSAFAVFRLFGVSTTASSQIYNNTIYVNGSTNSAITTRTPAARNLYLTNNIIYNTGSGGYDSAANEIWNYNTFYGNHPSSEPADAHKLTSNPDFQNPGGAGSGRGSASAYILKSGSPDLGSGVLISNNGGKDFFGNPVSSSAAPNRGAY